MKNLFIVFALLLAAACASGRAGASQPEIIPPYHWTYRSLAALSAEGLIYEEVFPGRSAFTKYDTVMMIITAANRIENARSGVTRFGLSALRRLIKGYWSELEAEGYAPGGLLKDIDEFADRLGLAGKDERTARVERLLSAGAARSVNSFAFDMYGALAKTENSNFVFSPYGISAALSMLYAGARGRTEAEMERVLHADPGIHEKMSALAGVINDTGPEAAEIRTVNAVWPAARGRMLPDFLETVANDYGASVIPLDYEAGPERARRKINKWVEERTDGKIKDLIASGMIDRFTALVLTNTIYFKAGWLDPFREEDTIKSDFMTSGGKTVSADMMSRTGGVMYAKFGDAAAAELPYAQRRYSLFVFLPDAIGGLPALEKELTAGKADKWISSMKEEYVRVTVPKFKNESSFELSRLLEAMGMPSAFGAAADFFGIDGRGEIHVGSVFHSALIETGEKGSEASAASAVVVAKMSLPPRSPKGPIEFRADRPFVYMIRDNQSGAILFAGRMASPS